MKTKRNAIAALTVATAALCTVILVAGKVEADHTPARTSGPRLGETAMTQHKIVKTEEEWKKTLEPDRYRVMRENGTEAPFSGTYWNHKESGVYRCAGCGQELFLSQTKFDSGCGWPSYFRPIGEKTLTEIPDTSHGMIRTEVRCSRCGSHLGHVFDDGPKPTGLRYCINSVALDFDKSGAAAATAADTNRQETAIFAAGCFWGVEAAFRRVSGVVDTAVGYTGGKTENPTYRQVCSDTTGHAEAVQVRFDPSRVSYARLLDVFWNAHDPTQYLRQGPDHGSQYRSAIFYLADEQRTAAQKSKETVEKSGRYQKPVVTEIERAGTFWRAEEYHQRYHEKQGRAACGG